MLESKTKVYYAIRDALRRPDVRYVNSEGGTRSSKTFSALQVLIEIAKGCRGLIISVVSETFPHLKRGAIRDFKEILADEWQEKAWNKSSAIYAFDSGSIIEFFSADQPGKVHGPARDILFINEANHISYDTARQLFVRTRLFILFDYNPTHAFWAHEQIAPRNNCVSIHSTYKDNDYLTPFQIAEIESNKGDENWWRVYGEGKVGQLEGLIFPDFDLVDEMPQAGGGLREVYGMDFGFTNDPSTLIREMIDTGRKEIWIEEIFYATGMLNSAMAAAMEEAQVPKRSTLIFADCAEPKTIAELAGYGYNIKPCYKATRKAEQLQIMKGYRLKVTKRSLNTIRELRNYCWMQDKDGHWLNEPQEFGDHAMDAARYGAVTFLTQYANAGKYTLSFL